MDLSNATPLLKVVFVELHVRKKKLSHSKKISKSFNFNFETIMNFFQGENSCLSLIRYSCFCDVPGDGLKSQSEGTR